MLPAVVAAAIGPDFTAALGGRLDVSPDREGKGWRAAITPDCGIVAFDGWNWNLMLGVTSADLAEALAIATVLNSVARDEACRFVAVGDELVTVRNGADLWPCECCWSTEV